MSSVPALPLGPDSLTWKHFGDFRSLLLLGRAGILQNMHPALDAALRDHSNFFRDPMDRFERSIAPIHSMIYQPPADDWAGKVRDFHKPIKGTTAHGERYSALNPDVFWWTHVTFYESIIATREFFGTPFTDDEKRQVIAEGVTWWRQYGLSERPVFGDLESFESYWDTMFAEVLERNFTTDFSRSPDGLRIPPPPSVPMWLWRIVRVPVMRLGNWVTNATMPPRARAILGWRWTRRDQLLFEVFRRAVRVSWHLLPKRRRYLAASWEGMERERRDPAAYRITEAAVPAVAPVREQA